MFGTYIFQIHPSVNLMPNTSVAMVPLQTNSEKKKIIRRKMKNLKVHGAIANKLRKKKKITGRKMKNLKAERSTHLKARFKKRKKEKKEASIHSFYHH